MSDKNSLPTDLQKWQEMLQMEENNRWPPYMPLGSLIRARRDQRFQAWFKRLMASVKEL